MDIGVFRFFANEDCALRFRKERAKCDPEQVQAGRCAHLRNLSTIAFPMSTMRENTNPKKETRKRITPIVAAPLASPQSPTANNMPTAKTATNFAGRSLQGSQESGILSLCGVLRDRNSPSGDQNGQASEASPLNQVHSSNQR